MTDENTAPEVDEATAAAELAALEEAAENGEAVTPRDLAEAREKVTLAGLWARGRAKRAAVAQEKAEAAARTQAKADAAAIFENEDAPFDDVRARISAAVSELLTLVADRNAQIEEVARLFDSVRLPTPNSNQADVLDVPGIDVDNYVRWDHGGVVSFVQVGGKAHAPAAPNTVALKAINAAMQANNLPTLDIRRS